MPTDTKPISEFLARMHGQKSVSVMVAGDQAELRRFQTELKDAAFLQAKGMGDLFRLLKAGGKVWMRLDAMAPKDAYDVMAQYTTGQIEIFDPVTMSSSVVSPSGDLSFVVVTSDEYVRHLLALGFDVLSVAGLTYREPTYATA